MTSAVSSERVNLVVLTVSWHQSSTAALDALASVLMSSAHLLLIYRSAAAATACDFLATHANLHVRRK